MPSDEPHSIRVGETLSHYRITAAIGAGGMGEVYRATDLNLHRDVAIKILPVQVAQDPDRLSRFRREAHLLAALNHPNIAAIYGLEESGGQPFLALELVDGQDLSERLKHGAIPVDEALAIALQVAEALEEAHNKGIVHRDLKPANVKLTPDAKVKVLDFGLAKAWAGGAEGSSASAEVSQSPTLAFTGTVAGVILGTAAYMSPEQARGKPVDKRADVWAFGVLLYEMLAARKLFTGDTLTDVIAAVVTREPDLSVLPAGTPPAVRRLVARCLQKDPRKRLPDMGTARLELQEVLAGGADAIGPAPAADNAGARRIERGRRTRERWAWAALALCLAGIAGYLAFHRAGARAGKSVAARFLVDVPETLNFLEFPGQLALSPDGRTLVFVTTPATGDSQLWVRPLDALEAYPLAGTEGGSVPFWSPDSASIAFFAAGELRRVALSGGAIQRICAMPKDLPAGGTWNDAGTIVFSVGGPEATLYQVPGNGGEPTPLTTLDKARGETGHWWPQFLPGGREFLFSVGTTGAADGGLFLASLQKPSDRHQVLADRGLFQYAAGNLVSVREGILTARTFDPGRPTVTGAPVSVATGVAVWSGNRGWGVFSTSSGGHLTWLSTLAGEVQLQWIDRNGKPLGTLGEKGHYGQIALSPDDRRVAAEVAKTGGRYNLWILDVARGVANRLTSDAADDRDPVWSPDSTQLIYSSDASGDQNLVRASLVGYDPPAPLPGGIGQTPGDRDIAESWTKDGTLLYMVQGSAGQRTMYTVSPDGKAAPEVLSKDRFGSDEHHVSPDGRWLTYISRESGAFEVYVQPFRRSGEKVRVSTNGGGQPRWRGDSKEIFYLSLDGALMAANVRENAGGLEVGTPTTLVPADRLKATMEDPDYDDYAVTSDGQRFLVKVAAAKSARPRIHMLLNGVQPAQ